MTKKKPSKMKCLGCQEEKAGVNFYVAQSPLYKNNDGKFIWCKECMIAHYDSLVAAYGDERLALYHYCMNFDILFNENLMESAYSQAVTNNSTLVRIYMQKIASLMQYKGKTSKDGQHLELTNIEQEKTKYKAPELVVDDEEYVAPIITVEVIRRWGNGYTNDEYNLLEQNYQDFINAYQHDTPAEQIIFKNICKTMLESERARISGNFTAFEKLNASISKMMGDANIKPKDVAGSNENETSTWGTWIARIENERPIPQVADEFKDVDKLGHYINKWFTTQMKRVFELESRDCYETNQD